METQPIHSPNKRNDKNNQEYYLLTAHGNIQNGTFIPRPNQTIIFFSLPGEVTTLDMGFHFLYNTNIITEKCLNKKKQKEFNQQLKTCQSLNKLECEKHNICRLRGKLSKKNRKCLPKLSYYDNPLEILSNEQNINNKCQDLQCEICKILKEDYNYNISIWNSDRIEKDGKGVPDLSLVFNPLFNNDRIYKYGVYKLPNTALDEYKKLSGKNPLTRLKFNVNMGVPPSTKLDGNINYHNLVVDEIFKGSIPSIYDSRKNLVNQTNIRLSTLLQELPDGVYFVLACRSTEISHECKIHNNGNRLLYFNKDNNLFKANNLTTSLLFTHQELFTFNGNINQISKFYLPNYYINEIKYISTSNVHKYKIGDYLYQQYKIINIEEDLFNKPTGSLQVEYSEPLSTFVPNNLCQFIYSYNFIREYYDLINYKFNYPKYISISKSIHILRDDNTNYGKNNWVNARIIKFLPNIIDITYLRNRLNNISRYFPLIYYGSNFLLGYSNVLGNKKMIRLKISNILGYNKFISYLEATNNNYSNILGSSDIKTLLKQSKSKLEKINKLSGLIVPAQILWNEKDWNIISQTNLSPEWKNFVSSIDKIKSHNHKGEYNKLLEFIYELKNFHGLNYEECLDLFVNKESLDDIKELYEIMFLEKNKPKSSSNINIIIKDNVNSIFKQYNKLAKHTSYCPFDSIINQNPHYDIRINNVSYLLNLSAYPFFHNEEIDDINQLSSRDSIPIFNNNSRLVIFCNEPNVFPDVYQVDCIREWKKLSQFRNYSHKAIIGTVYHENLLKRDDGLPDLDLNIFLYKLFNTRNSKNSLLQFLRLPYGDKLAPGKTIWIRKTLKTNPNRYISTDLPPFESNIIQKVHIKGFTDPPSIVIILKLLESNYNTYWYTNIKEVTFLFDDEMEKRFPIHVALKRQDSFNRRKLFNRNV